MIKLDQVKIEFWKHTLIKVPGSREYYDLMTDEEKSLMGYGPDIDMYFQKENAGIIHTFTESTGSGFFQIELLGNNTGNLVLFVRNGRRTGPATLAIAGGAFIYAFDVLALDSIESFAHGANINSMRLQERFLKRTGLIRDHYSLNGHTYHKFLYRLSKETYTNVYVKRYGNKIRMEGVYENSRDV